MSRLDTIVDDDGTALAAVTYLGLDERVQMSYPEPNMQLTLVQQAGEPVGDGGDQYVGLDRFGRLVDQRWLNSAAADIERVKFGYSRASNRVWRQNTVAGALGIGQDEFYTNDGLYQLAERHKGTLNAGKTGISGTPTAEEDFTYDPTGNWANYETKASGSVTLNQPRTHNVDNEITPLSGSAALVSYDHAGNMTTTPQPASWSNAYALTWDAWNRLTQLKSGSTVVAGYAYDGLTRRTTQTASGTARHYYYSDQWKVLEERLDTATVADRQFVWRGCDEDKLILRYLPATGELLCALDDGKDVAAVCNTSGAVLERYGYSGFGAPVFMDASFGVRSVSSYAWETSFCGYRFDSCTELYQIRYRYLGADLGRWLSRDPAADPHFLIEYTRERKADGSHRLADEIRLNLFGFVSNNPGVFVDPDGLGTWYFGVDQNSGVDYGGRGTPTVTVAYRMDARESKCCDACTIYRFVRNRLGNWQADGSFGNLPGQPFQFAPKDEPGVSLWNPRAYFFSEIQFRSFAVCSAEPSVGHLVSFVQPTYEVRYGMGFWQQPKTIATS